MTNVVLQGARPGNRRRKPKTYDDGRICSDDGCSTLVSRYNRSDFCFSHRPVHYPRMRGVFTEEFQQAS
jgi:hypothetical protein